MSRYTEDVKIQFEDKVNADLAGTSSIYFQGVDFDTAKVTEWFEPRVVGFTPRGAMAGKRLEDWTFQVGCFAKVGAGGEKTSRVWQLADVVLTNFTTASNVPLKINVNDWTGGTEGSQVGVLQFLWGDVEPVPRSGLLPTQSSELQQLSVTIPALYYDIGV